MKDVDAAVAFYVKAFGATEPAERVRAPDGPQVAVLWIGGHLFGVATEGPHLGTPGPESLGATTVRTSLDVEDPDGVTARAITAGALEMFPVENQPYGMRQGRLVDPFGHHPADWWPAQGLIARERMGSALQHVEPRHLPGMGARLRPLP